MYIGLTLVTGLLLKKSFQSALFAQDPSRLASQRSTFAPLIGSLEGGFCQSNGEDRYTRSTTGRLGVEVEATCNCETKGEAPTPAGASVLTIRISFYGPGDCDSTICISVCSHIYLTNLFAATGKYHPSVIREKNAVLINQANISRPLALYAIRSVVSLLVICYLLALYSQVCLY